MIKTDYFKLRDQKEIFHPLFHNQNDDFVKQSNLNFNKVSQDLKTENFRENLLSIYRDYKNFKGQIDLANVS